MPDDPYVNPDRKPYSGRYNWVPPTIPSAGDTASFPGWLDLRHERGLFRNDYYINSSSTNYTLLPSNASGTGITYYGNPEWPINVAFRRKQNPTPIVPPVANSSFWIKSNTFWWQAIFDPIATKLSAITFEYSLLVDIDDDKLLNFLFESPVHGANDDYENLLKYKKGEINIVNIDWTKYIFGKIKLFTSTDTEDTAEYFPKSFANNEATSSDQLKYTISKNFTDFDTLQVYRALPGETFLPVSPDEYQVDSVLNGIVFKSKQLSNTKINITLNYTPFTATGYFKSNQDSSSDSKILTIHFDYGSSLFKDIQKLRIEPLNSDGPLIKLILKKILLFKVLSNPRVNINNSQLPCRILAYAFNINCKKIIPGLNDYYPNNNRNPTFYVKMFHPEDIIKSRGFAHGIDLRFFVPSFPIFTFDGFSLTGGINDANYWVVFVGPLLSKTSVIYYMTSNIITESSISGRLFKINDFNINTNSTIYIQKVNSSTKPDDAANWQNLYVILNTSNIIFDNNFVKPWLFYDQNGNSNSWYRLIQFDLNTSVSSTTESTKGLIYTEKSLLKLENTGVSNSDIAYIKRPIQLLNDLDPLTLDPIAIFSVDNVEDLLSKNILFGKGQWKFAIKARCNDPYNQVNTHLFLRFWFHPGEEIINYDLPNQYRNYETEIIFENYNTDPTNNTDPKPSVRLKIGTPNTLDNLIVTPALTQDFNVFEVIRYADGLGGNNLYTSPFTSPTTKLIIGVYSFSYLQNSSSSYDFNIKSPSIEIEIDPVESRLETTILKNSSGTLAASRYYAFQRTNFIHFNTDSSNSLKLTRNIYEGGLVGIGNSYINYNSKYLVIDSIKNPSGDSRVGLATFESGVGDYTNPDTKICIPHTNYSLNDDKSVYFFADFTTKGSYFQDGKVNASTWSIGFRINRSLDNIRIPADYKIQAFFVDRYGKVTERVFTSPYLKLSSGTGEVANLSYSTEISNPFFITGTDAHLIIRLISYPRSSNGQEVTEAELNNIQESLLGNTIGTRIKNFYLTISPSPGNSSGLTKLNIVDAAGFTGSTRFYEDLDLVPANSLDSQQFWFYANSETLKAQIIERGKDFIIMGALYSPTWLVNLPKDIEVSVIGGIAFNSDYPSDLKIRTVLDDKATTVEDMVKVAEDQLSNSLHIVYNGETEADSTLTNVIKYIKINDLNNVIGYSGLIAGQNNSQRSILSGEDPIIFTMGSESSSSNYDLIGILTENQSGDGSNVNVSINSDGGLLDYWMRPNYSFSADDFTSALSIASRKITKVDCKVYFLDGLLYIVGIVNPGAILVRKVDLYMTQSESDPPPGFNFLVDGPVDISETIDYIDEYVEYSTQLSGALAVDTRPSIIVTNKGMIFVAYVLEGYNKQILCKILTTGGEQLTDALPILDMSLSNVSSSELEVFCPVLAYDSKLDIIYCAFWCAGKIFLTSLTFNDVCESYTLGLIYLIAGNRDLNNDNNAANSMLRSLQDSGYLIVDQNGDLESDLHRQSVGLVVSNHLDHNNQLIFIYKTSVEKNSEIYSRKFYNDGSVSERILIS